MAGPNQHRQLKDTCEALVRAGNGVLHWGWDDYLGATLAVFPSSDAAKVAAILEKALPSSWDVKTASQASAPAKAQIDSMGGLRAGQRFFASDVDHGAAVFAAWWPWGDGKKVSLRVGTVYPGAPATEVAELTKELRSWFGI